MVDLIENRNVSHITFEARVDTRRRTDLASSSASSSSLVLVHSFIPKTSHGFWRSSSWYTNRLMHCIKLKHIKKQKERKQASRKEDSVKNKQHRAGTTALSKITSLTSVEVEKGLRLQLSALEWMNYNRHGHHNHDEHNASGISSAPSAH